MSAFERHAVQRILDRAHAAGVDIPAELHVADAMFHGGTYPARVWAEANPGVDDGCCCWGSIARGPDHCDCWVPVFELEQAEPCPPAGPDDIAARKSMCGDCAFRPGSPERSDEWTAEALYASAESGRPFWCHDGLRRPAYWLHPDGRRVEGSPDDWQPPIVAGIPYRADGRPGLLCAGWAAVAAARHGRTPEEVAPC